MKLDDIYESFIWDESYTKEEYDSNVALGIEEGKKYKYLYPFIMPVIPEKSKCIWDPCAKVIAMKSDEEIKPYLVLLFKGFQDMNWPGALTIFERLLKIPFFMLEEEFYFSRRCAERDNNTLWLTALDDFKKQSELLSE